MSSVARVGVFLTAYPPVQRAPKTTEYQSGVVLSCAENRYADGQRRV